MSDKDDIKNVRAQIDAVDLRLLELLKQRADLARHIGRLKEADNPAGEVYCPARETSHLRELLKRDKGLLQDASIVAVFREIMSACRALERKTTVSFLGPRGTFTMEAVFHQFGHSIACRGQSAIEEVFRSVEVGESDYGVVPIENSSEGAVTGTLDCFVSSPLRIVGEVELRISHCLLGKERDLQAVKTVYAHQQSLAQCRGWLAAHLAHCDRVGVESNGLAAQKAAQESGAVAIAGKVVAESEALPVIAENIEDHPNNTTRFLVIGKQGVAASGCDKTSVIVSAHNRPGVLAELLRTLSEQGLSLTRIESRPAHTANWEYLFFLDIAGHCDDGKVARGLDELAQKASFYKLLGSYPCSVK